MITPADTPPVAPEQMPAAPNAGPAPVPGPNLNVDTAGPGADIPHGYAPGAGVMDGVSGNAVQESGYAHDVGAHVADAPYSPGVPQAIYVGGDADAGGRDDMAAAVAGAVANAMARQAEHQADTYGLGSVIGDLMTFPPNPIDPGTAPGITEPAGGFYDPPRNYGA